MKQLVLFLSLSLCFTLSAQMTEEEVLEHRKNHLATLMDTSSGYLKPEEITSFKGLDYFDFDSGYQVVATFKKSKGKKFEMPTSTERLPVYRRYGYVTFTIDDTELTLEVYQNIEHRKHEEYRNYLFIPFRDGTSGKESYGGGRYLEVLMPEGKELELDFNLCFNPYCVYSDRYSCPVPPKENTLEIGIKAGEKTPPGYGH